MKTPPGMLTKNQCLNIIRLLTLGWPLLIEYNVGNWWKTRCERFLASCYVYRQLWTSYYLLDFMEGSKRTVCLDSNFLGGSLHHVHFWLHTNILEDYTASTFKVKVRKDGKLWLEDQARRSCQSESGRRRWSRVSTNGRTGQCHQGQQKGRLGQVKEQR